MDIFSVIGFEPMTFRLLFMLQLQSNALPTELNRGYSLDINKHNIIGFITQLGAGGGEVG